MRSLLITGALGLLLIALTPRFLYAGPNDATNTDTKPATDAEQAERLFEEGRQLKDHGELQKACEKFDQALQLNRNAVGTILNVALCDEQAGKIASAWKLFAEARDRAAEQKLEEHRKAAEDHIGKLEGRIPHLAIAFAEAPTPDTKLVVDDQIIPVSAAGKVPIDPGMRTITVNAPGRVPYETKIEISESQDKAVAIPKLGYPVTVKKGRRTIGKVLTYSGVGLVAAGIGIGLYARSHYRAQFAGAHPECTELPSGTPSCSTQGYTETHNAQTYGWVGTGVGAAGIVAVGIGAVLWFFGPSESDKLAIIPSISPDQAGFAAIGRF